MINWKITRRIILGVILLFFLVIAKAGGVFIDLIILFLYFVPVLGMKIYKKGTRYIAKTNAEEIAKALKKDQK